MNKRSKNVILPVLLCTLLSFAVEFFTGYNLGLIEKHNAVEILSLNYNFQNSKMHFNITLFSIKYFEKVTVTVMLILDINSTTKAVKTSIWSTSVPLIIGNNTISGNFESIPQLDLSILLITVRDLAITFGASPP